MDSPEVEENENQELCSSNDEGKADSDDVTVMRQQSLTRINSSDWSEYLKENITAILCDTIGPTVGIVKKNLSDEGAITLGEAIQINTSVITLFLSRNNIGIEGALAIASALRVNTTLTDLGLEGNNIGDEGAIAIGEALRTNSTLRALDISRNGIGTDGVTSLVESLKENNTIRLLDLQKNETFEYGCYMSLARLCKLNNIRLCAKPRDAPFHWLDQASQERKIGSGEFGNVNLHKKKRWFRKDAPLAAKRSAINSIDQYYENLILQGLPPHKNVVKLAGYSGTFVSVLEAHLGGSLKKLSQTKQGVFSVSQFFNLALGMALSVEHLHSNGLAHRDLAQRNYVLSDDLTTAILVDFGLSWPILEDEFVEIATNEKVPYRQCPPEVLNILVYFYASDIWELGLTFWQFLHGQDPFSNFGVSSLRCHLYQFMVEQPGTLPIHYTETQASPSFVQTVKELVDFCCVYELKKRPTASQVVQTIKDMKQTTNLISPRFSLFRRRPQSKDAPVKNYTPNQTAVDAGLSAYKNSAYTDWPEYYINLTPAKPGELGGRKSGAGKSGKAKSRGSKGGGFIIPKIAFNNESKQFNAEPAYSPSIFPEVGDAYSPSLYTDGGDLEPAYSPAFTEADEVENLSDSYSPALTEADEVEDLSDSHSPAFTEG